MMEEDPIKRPTRGKIIAMCNTYIIEKKNNLKKFTVGMTMVSISKKDDGESDLSSSFSNMSITPSQIYQFDNEIRRLDTMSISGNKKTLIQHSPLETKSQETIRKRPSTKHNYSFVLHKDGCVNSKAAIQISCNIIARSAIKSAHLRLLNSKEKTQMMEVTDSLNNNSSTAGNYVIAKSTKSD